ncbi:HPP family protein (plasmid) [Streptomyces sp. BI20]|uniref:HPP family protein n=1 Tax=Streptomyces sp. BI20 TaxID=3403460 RepID=UPI003C74C34F
MNLEHPALPETPTATAAPAATPTPAASGVPVAASPSAVPSRRAGRPRVGVGGRLAGRAPAPPTVPAVLHNASAVTVALLALVGIGALVHEPMLIPPIAASAAIVHSVPHLPLAQPRSVVLGHLLSAALGFLALGLLGPHAWVAALAAGLALAVMTIARTPHSPACATAVVIVLRGPDPRSFVPLLALACVLLVAAGWAASRARPTAPRYPLYWW